MRALTKKANMNRNKQREQHMRINIQFTSVKLQFKTGTRKGL
jgi:hypothetical protein